MRFPRILRIGKEEPFEFQELVRRRFPQFGVEQGFQIQLPDLGGESAPMVGLSPRVYRFSAADGYSSLSLASEFYALTTNRYTHWKEFLADLCLAHEATQQVYQPAYATRIGLRYVDRLSRSNTGCQTVAELWGFLRPELTALLRAKAWSEPANLLTQLLLTDGDANLTLRTAYEQEQGEPFFILDFDYFEEGQLALNDISGRIGRYHDVIYDAFRWSLKDDKLAAFQPSPNDQE
ncbi:MAG: TIGR04255 family protein [Chloroflexi bacterium]|nr:TIGR04255 family protein [Chloroflexota bacterium]MBI3732483.1 TIGR04255 family protein [Chloroflexota bacterium]